MKRRVVPILLIGFLGCVAASVIYFIIVLWSGGALPSEDGLYCYSDALGIVWHKSYI